MMDYLANLFDSGLKVKSLYNKSQFYLIIHSINIAEDYEEPSELPDSILPFSQIGPPRNLLVTVKPDGYLVTWEPPEYGNDQFGLYILRWYREPEHKLEGEHETTKNYFNGKKFILNEINWKLQFSIELKFKCNLVNFSSRR